MPRIRKSARAVPSAIWKIALYIRLSREDWKEDAKADDRKGNKKGEPQETADVSRSIIEQSKMLQEYVETRFQDDEYIIVDTYADDGLTGTDDARDNFQRMMEAVDTGKVNCIIVKTLSRAFRNYADQGRYLEQVFPLKGVRFISTGNPFVDSFTDPEAIQNGMEIPINGLMNDRYAAKTSFDIRRTFDAKRRRGEFIGAFAPYGYIKNPENKNSLLVDEEAAQTVREIFRWFVTGGMSKMGIAKKLNELGVPNPTAYKVRVQQLRYRNPQIALNDGHWCSAMIQSILQNEVYMGNMVQGRHRIISYKVHTQIRTPEEEWYIVPDTHEAIIEKGTFHQAQALHARDTRTAPGKREVHMFAGFLRCADCQKAMRRKSSKGWAYYQCRTKIDKGMCTKHTIREDKLSKAVLDAIRIQISLVEDLAETLHTIHTNPNAKTQSNRLNAMLTVRNEEMHKMVSATDSLYLDWKSGDITKEDYRRMKARFDEKISKLSEAIAAIQGEMDTLAKGVNSDDACLNAFRKRGNITTLERSIIVELIDAIYIHEDGQMTIDFAFADEVKRAHHFIEKNRIERTVVGSETDF